MLHGLASLAKLSHTLIRIVPMATKQAQDSAQVAKRLTWLGAALCALCCAMPVIGIAAGSSGAAAAGVYLKSAALASLAGAAVVATIWVYRRRQVPRCGVDCECASGGRSHACR